MTIFLVIILFIQFIAILLLVDRETNRPYEKPDYLHMAAQDMVWNRDKIYKDK